MGYTPEYFQGQLSKSDVKVAVQYGRLLRGAGVDPAALRGRRVLDAGCGAGPALRYLERLGAEAIGLDLVLYALRQARRQVRAPLVAGDLSQGIPLASESVDLVLLADVIEHLEPEAGRLLLEECRRVLRPGGRVIVGTVNGWDVRRLLQGRRWSGYRDPTHRVFYTPRSLARALRAAGFGRVRTRSGLKPVLWLPTRRLLGRWVGLPYPPLIGNGLLGTGVKEG